MAGNILGTILLNIVTKANDSGINKVDRSLKKVGQTAKSVQKSAGLLSALSGKLFGGFSISSVKDMFMSYLQFEKDLGAMKSRFYAITHDELKSEQEFQFIKNLAVETAQDIKSTADSYSIFYTAARKGLGQEGAREVFTNWTKVSRVLHLSAYQFERITYALREMTSKGKLYAQDLQMQIGTHVPDAVGIATEAIKSLNLKGVTTLEEFQKVAKNNIPLINKFVAAFSRKAAERFGNPEALKKAMQQPDALAQSIANYGFLFKEAFAKSGGSFMVIKILQGTLDVLKKVDFYSITNYLGEFSKKIGNIYSFLTTNIKTIITLLKIMAYGYIGGKVGGFLRAGRFFILKQIVGIRKLFASTLAGSLLGGRLGLSTITSAGKSSWIARIISMGFMTGGKRLFGTLIARLLGFFGGPLGIAIGIIISLLPQIVNGINSLRYKFMGKDAMINDFVASTGMSKKEIYDKLMTLEKRRLDSHGFIGGLLRDKDVVLGKKLGGMVEVREGKLVINFNGNFITIDDIKDEIGQAINMSNNGNITNKIFNGRYGSIGKTAYESAF